MTNDCHSNSARIDGTFEIQIGKSITERLTIENAAMDPLDHDEMQIFFTLVEDRAGIFSFCLNEDSKKKSMAKPVICDQARRYGSLAVNKKWQLLFCCDSKLNNDIGIWSMASGQLLHQVKHQGLEVFKPVSLSIFCGLDSSCIQMAVVVTSVPLLSVFTIGVIEDENGSTCIEEQSVVDVVDGTSLQRPCATFFDQNGHHLLSADEGLGKIMVRHVYSLF